MSDRNGIQQIDIERMIEYIMERYNVCPKKPQHNRLNFEFVICSSIPDYICIGGSRGRAPRTPPKGPDCFVLTYKIFEM